MIMMMMNVMLKMLLINICQTLDHHQCKHTLWLVGGHHVGLPVSLLANFLIHHHPHLHNHLPNNIAIQLGKDMRMKSREAPSTDLGDWMFYLIVLWKSKEHRVVQLRRRSGGQFGERRESKWERDQRSEKGQKLAYDCIIYIHVFGGAAMQ